MIFILLDYRERPPYRKGVSVMDPQSLDNMLAEDANQCHVMNAAAPGSPKTDTLTTATAKAIAAGKSLKDIMAAALSGYLTGGLAGAIAAVLALLVQP